MAVDMKNRREVIEELVTLFFSRLAMYSTEQLEAILQRMRGSQGLDITGKGHRAPNDAAVLVIRPDASKEETVSAVQQIAKWLDENWEEIRSQSEEGGAIQVGAKGKRESHLLN